MEKWILIVNMIITMQGDNEPEIKQAVIEPAFNQLMKFCNSVKKFNIKKKFF